MQHNRTSIFVASIATAVVLLTGCASSFNTASTSEFSCSDKSGCPTPFEVYNQTNNAPPSVRSGRTPEQWGVSGSKDKEGKGRAQGVHNEEVRMDLTHIAPSSSIQVQSDPVAQPIRQPSQVMRIWIAPWIDQSDNLNWSGYIYTEVTPKRWAFGEKEIRYQGMVPQFNAQPSAAR